MTLPCLHHDWQVRVWGIECLVCLAFVDFGREPTEEELKQWRVDCEQPANTERNPSK